MRRVELDTRKTSQLTIVLYWLPDAPADRCIAVSVKDGTDAFTLRPNPSLALDAFRHPYVYRDSMAYLTTTEVTA